MGKKVVVIGTLDTKGPETAYLRDRLEALGLETTVVDSGILDEPVGITPDISRAEAATYGDTTIEALRNAGSRGKAVDGMRAALKVLTRELYAEAWPGIGMLAKQGRFSIAAAAAFYRGILEDIERHDYDVFSRRAYVSKWGKLRRLPGIWWSSRRTG